MKLSTTLDMFKADSETPYLSLKDGHGVRPRIYIRDIYVPVLLAWANEHTYPKIIREFDLRL